MTFLKALFFTLPLMAVAAIGLAYLLHFLTVQPRVEEILLKLEAATTQMEQAEAESQAITDTLQQMNVKLDTLLSRP